VTLPKFEFYKRLPKEPRPRPLMLEFAEALRERRGEWGKWPRHLSADSARVVPRRVNRGLYKWLPLGEFEAVQRGVNVYVRYIGPRHPAPVDADLDETPDEYDDEPHECDDNCTPGNCAVEHALEFDATLVRPGSDHDPDVAYERDVIDAANGVI
jgi:hypothetical protein